MDKPLTIDPNMREIHDKLNRILSERFVMSNDDIGYVKKIWDITTIIQDGIGYEGECIQPWSSVEQIITDCYLDLFKDADYQISSDRRVESLMQLYDTILGYIFEKINKKTPGDLRPYLKANIPKLSDLK